jgi:hypothetical protein
MVGKKLSFRGVLGFGEVGCTMMGCDDHVGRCCVNSCFARWTITVRATHVRVVLLKRQISANECEFPKSPNLDVIATGVLIKDPNYTGGESPDGFILKNANLCVVEQVR